MLWVYAAFLIATMASAYFSDFSPSLTAAYEAEQGPWLMNNLPIAAIVLAVLALAATVGFIGLFWFRSWARSLSLYSTLTGFFVLPFYGASLESGIENMLGEASATLWGAILTLAYFSTVSEQFGVKSLDTPQTHHN